MTVSRLSHRIIPVFLATTVFTAALQAGPHHAQKWVEGNLTQIDLEHKELTLATSSAGENTRVVWDSETKEFDNLHAKGEALQSILPGGLKQGDHLRIRCRETNGLLLARHVIVAPASAESSTK